MPQERRLAAILSADVAGYSRLMAEDEQGTIQTLKRGHWDTGPAAPPRVDRGAAD